MNEEHTPYSEKVNVCSEIVGDHISGSFHIDDVLNESNCLPILQNNVLPFSEILNPDPQATTCEHLTVTK